MGVTNPHLTATPLHVAMLSSYVPRECGIATYADDVVQALEMHYTQCSVIAMDHPGHAHQYHPRVVSTIREDQQEDYLTAAGMINRGGFDLLAVQHEFGIYGGPDTPHLRALLEQVRIPIVATLHTIEQQPSAEEWQHLHVIGQQAQAIVVMNGLAIRVLHRVYGIDPRKVVVIHHGAPVPPSTNRSLIRQKLFLRGKTVLSTFGLLSPSKGLEYVIRALPHILEHHPETMYYIIGETHPMVRKQLGERYRESLQALARELGVQNNVQFVNRYLSKNELINYLLATDIYVTPYLNLDQVTSGTLAYAMACGCPVVATPYLHARFLLADGRGLLVPPENVQALARASLHLLDNPHLRAHMAYTNWHFGQNLLWPLIGKEYLQVFRRVVGR
ncbi:MAG: glycosyltransferase family 4 protein [Armatimonadota bacterium]